MKKPLRLPFIFFYSSVIVLLIVFALYTGQFKKLLDSNNQALQTSLVIRKMQKVQSLLLEVENAEKSFLLNQQDTVKAYKTINKKSKQIFSTLDTLNQLTRSNKLQRQKLVKIKDDVANRMYILNKSVEEALDSGKAALDVYESRENRLMIDFGRLMGEFEREEVKKMDMAEAERKNSETLAPRYVELSLALTMVFLAVSFALMVGEIRHRKKYEKDLEQKITELDENKKEVEQIIFVTSHNLKEPLRKIRTFNNRLSACSNDERSEKEFKKVDSLANHLQQLIDDVVNYASLLKPTEPAAMVNLETCVNSAEAYLHDEITRTGAVINKTPLGAIEGYAQQLDLLFIHLIQNAIKYGCNQGSIKIDITGSLVSGQSEISEVDSNSGPGYLKVSVSDNGIGFDNDFAGKIFMLFQRLPNDSTTAGRGIGLAICKRIMFNHKGRIKATGMPGEGATFDLYFPYPQA